MFYRVLENFLIALLLIFLRWLERKYIPFLEDFLQAASVRCANRTYQAKLKREQEAPNETGDKR